MSVRIQLSLIKCPILFPHKTLEVTRIWHMLFVKIIYFATVNCPELAKVFITMSVL